MGEAHVPMTRLTASAGRFAPRMTRIRRAGLASRESDSGLFSQQELTRTKSCGRALLCLWMDSWVGCADSANHIT